MDDLERAHRCILETACGADIGGLGEWLAREHVLHQSVIEGLPEGIAATRALFRFYREALGELVIVIDDQLRDGDRIASRFRLRGRHTGSLGAIAATGAEVRLTGTLVSRFDGGGLAVESWLEVSALGLLRDLGVIEMVNPVRVVES